MSYPKHIRPIPLAATLAFVTLALGGCAGTGVAPASDGAPGGIDVAQASADLAAVIDVPDAIDVQAISSAIPEDQSLSVLACALAVCTDVATGVKEAATALGWRVEVVPSDSTPSGYQAAWDQIAQDPGNGIVNTSPVLPYSSVKTQIDAADAPIVSSTSPDPVGGHLIAVVSSENDMEIQGATEANWVIQDAGEPVRSVFVYDPSIPALAPALPGYQEAMKKNCPSCTVDVLEVSAAQIGPALAQQVVSQLQANPDTAYVAFGLGDLATGVPAAIKAAGLEGSVKLTTRAATPTNMADVKNGGMAVAFTAELFEAGWRSVDKLARALVGEDIGEQYPVGVIRQLTKDDLPDDISVSYRVPGFEESFLRAWGVS